MNAEICIIVLNWNGIDDTLVCLESIKAITYPNFFVLVVDNGSTDNSITRLKTYKPPYRLELISAGSNLGYAAGNNIGIKRALESGAKFVLLLNNDTAVAPDLLEHLVDAAERYPQAGMFSPRVMYLDQPDRVWFDGARWNSARLRMEPEGQGRCDFELGHSDHVTDSACGAALFVRADVICKVGLIDEDYFLVWEELDWSFRVRAAGWQILVVPRARVWHKVGVSFGTESSPLRRYFSVRNELLWFSRHATRIARLRLWGRTMQRLVPRFQLSTDSRTPLYKRLFWGLNDYFLAWLGKGQRLKYLSMRQAVFDYLHGRLGNCPESIRIWNKAWVEQRERNSQCST